MRKYLKVKFLLLLFWIIVVFGSIATLPNVESFVAQHITEPTDVTVATTKHHQWGHGLDNTRSLTLVFSDPDHQLTTTQHERIRTVLNGLKRRADYYGIKQLRTTTTSPNDHQLLTSNDGSTEVAIVAVKVRSENLPVTANQLNNAIAIPGLHTAVTSPELVARQHTQRALRGAGRALLFSSAILLVALGLIFRSLLVPLINLLIETIVLITTASLTTNAVNRWHLPFDLSGLVLMGLSGTLITTLLTWSYVHDYWSRPTKNAATAWATLKRQSGYWSRVLIPLALISLCTSWDGWRRWNVLATGWVFALTIVIVALVAWSVNYALTALLGSSLHWPGRGAWSARPRNVWGQVARFSHWRPLYGLFLATILLLPGLLNAKWQYADDNLQPGRQTALSSAEVGQQLLTAHFGNGAAAPVTLTVRSDHSLLTQHNLQTLDNLTEKLRAVDNVAQVVSITQPTGHRVTPFYVRHQLVTINVDLLGKQKLVKTLQKQLGQSTKDLRDADTRKQSQTVNQLTIRYNRVATANDQLVQAIADLDNTLSTANTTRRQTDRITDQLNQIDRSTDRLTTLLNDLADTQTTLIDQTNHVDQKVGSASQRLSQTTHELLSLMTSLKTTSTYLSGVANSQIGDIFYLPAGAKTNAGFKASRSANVSGNARATRLTITLKSQPTSPASLRTVATINQVAKASLLATPLRPATISSAGVTSQQAAHHQLVDQHVLVWLGIALAVLMTCLLVTLRSFTLSSIITVGLILVSTASWGWTQVFITKWLHAGQLSTTVGLWGFTLITLHWLVITTVTVANQRWLRQFNDVKLLRHFYVAGQLIWPFTVFELIYLLPLLLTNVIQLTMLALMAVTGILVSNLLLPLCLPGLLTWTVRPPKLRWLHPKHPAHEK